MHWIETKDTSNSLARAYNKITDKVSGVNKHARATCDA